MSFHCATLSKTASSTRFSVPFFFSARRRNNFSQGFAPIYAVPEPASLAPGFGAGHFATRPNTVDPRNYTKKEELFIRHVYRDRRSLPNPAGNTAEADKLPLFQQLETPPTRGSRLAAIVRSVPALSAGFACLHCVPYPRARANRPRYKVAAVRAA